MWRNRKFYSFAGPFILLCGVIFYGCTSYELSPGVEESLELAGRNRVELEAVLNHYKSAKEHAKFRAACFLIDNMKYHGSPESMLIPDPVTRYFEGINQASYREQYLLFQAGKTDTDTFTRLQEGLGSRFNTLPPPEIRKRPRTDLETIGGEFLIRHIDHAFETRRSSPWARSLSPEEFNEFILPYRVTDEEVHLSHPDLKERYSHFLPAEKEAGIHVAVGNFNRMIEGFRALNKRTEPEVHYGFYDLFLPKFRMNCHTITNATCNILRASGIPVVYEYTPRWQNRYSKHFWAASPDSAGIYVPYTVPDNTLKGDWENLREASKVYRRGFAANPESPFFLASPEEHIPPELGSPLISDQTFRYHQTVTLRVPFRTDAPNRLAYLCLLNGGSLDPVGWGVIDPPRQEICFEQVPLNLVFAIAWFEEEQPTLIGDPFVLYAEEPVDGIPLPLTGNRPGRPVDLSLREDRLQYTGKSGRSPGEKIRYMPVRPNGQTGEMLLLRKFPEKRLMKVYQERMVGASLLGSNTRNGDYDTLYTLTAVPIPHIQEIVLSKTAPYRYYRFTGHDGGGVYLSHLELLGPPIPAHHPEPPTPLPVFHPGEAGESPDNGLFRLNGTVLPTGRFYANAFDNNLETYCGDSLVEVDFQTPVEITRFRFAPRTANNMIIPGDTYELHYFDRSWKKQGIVTAEYNYLLFTGVPSGTLYWLRNTSRGKEELPFFYRDGKQFFMHVDDYFTDKRH